jgi:hypothetical protein
MCNCPKALHLRCGHAGAGTPLICHYRNLIGHTVTQDITRVDAICANCAKAGNDEVRSKEESDDAGVKDDREKR